MKLRSVTLLGCLALSVPLACDETPPVVPPASGGGPAASGGSVNPGTGGNAVPSGGNASCTGKACSGGQSNQGGEGGVVPQGGQGGQGGAPDNTEGCEPKVSFLLQRSGAMFEHPDGDAKWWDAIAEALDSDGDDLLDKYASQLELGVTTFYMTEEKDSCMVGDSTKFGLKPNGLSKFLSSQASAHESLVDGETKVDAPVAEALDAAAAKLGTSGDRYIVLAVSGNPDSCENRDGMCETIGVLEKVRELRMSGIHTKLLFLHSTELDGYAQALANVAEGRGARNFVENICNTDFNFAQNPMDAPYGHPDNVDGVKGALDDIFGQIAKCE